MICSDGNFPDQQIWIDNSLKELHHVICENFFRGCVASQIDRTMSILWSLPAIAIGFYRAGISLSAFRISQIHDVICYCQHQLICHNALLNQIQRHDISHLTDDQLGHFIFIWLLQHLTGADAAVFRTIALYICNGAWFPSPGMIDQKLSIDAKHPIEQILVFDRHPGDIAHCVHAC